MSERRYGGLQVVLDRMFVPLAAWSVQHSGWLLAASVVLLLAALFGASRVHQDNSMDAYFDASDPAFIHYKSYLREFNSDEVAYLVYDAPDAEDGVFDLAVMRQIERLTRAIELEVPFVRKVTSLANVELIEANGDDIVIRALKDNKDYDRAALLRLRQTTLAKPLYVGTLVSRDARYGAIVVEMTCASTDPIDKLRVDPNGGDDLPNLYPQAPNTKLRAILARPEYAGLKFLVTGDVPMNAVYNEILFSDSGIITLATLGLAALLCLLLFEARLLGLLAPLGVVVLSIVVTLAFMAVMGYQVTLLYLMLPTLLCAVGTAQAVHMLLNWQHEYAVTGSSQQAARIVLEKIATPALLCALTTAAGLVGMGASQLKAVRELGIYSAVGVLLSFVITLLLLTSLAARAKAHPSPSHAAIPAWLTRFITVCLETSLRHPRRVLAAFVGATMLAGVGVSKLRVDFNFLHEFKPHIEVRMDTERIERIMGGMLSVVYVFDTGQPDAIQEPAVIRAIESLQEFAETQPLVADTTSIVDYIKELNQAFHGGDPAYRLVPNERDALAQLMLVYELSGGKEMNDIRNIDRSKTVLELRVRIAGAAAVRELVSQLDRHIAAHPIPGIKVELSGIGLLWIKIADYISNSQISGASGSFLMILVFITVAFGSLRQGLWAMVPNVLPFIFALGFMGAMGWPLDYFRMMLASVTMGISVDDTIHLLARARVVFSESGNYRQTLRETMAEVGGPVSVTSIALVVAFSSYLLSSMAILSSFGMLLCGTVIVGLVTELLLTPALIVQFKPFGPERGAKSMR